MSRMGEWVLENAEFNEDELAQNNENNEDNQGEK